MVVSFWKAFKSKQWFTEDRNNTTTQMTKVRLDKEADNFPLEYLMWVRIVHPSESSTSSPPVLVWSQVEIVLVLVAGTGGQSAAPGSAHA